MLLKSAIFSLLFCSTFLQARAQEYTVESINPELKKNASAVIRLLDEVFEITSVSGARVHTRAVVTILNEDGRSFSIYNGMTDKFSATHLQKIVIYDANGKKVKSFGASRVEPRIVNSINIYDDNYFYRLDPDYRTYPFTVEIETTEDYKGLFQIPEWNFHPDYNVSTEKSVLKIIAPVNYKLRYFENRNPGSVSISTKDGTTTYLWQAENVPALLYEPLSVSLEKYSPSVTLAPSDFEIAGKKGNAESWQNFGLFRKELIKDREKIEGPVTDTVKALIASTPDTTEMIRRIYKFMQNRTRYVSIQEGIGGWQPIEAQKVDKTKYGDCKALANYTRALLAIAGIKSIYTVVRAGEDVDDILPSFPSNQTNHAILCVPRNNDTIWLECTDQYSPFNYLGSFTDDRHVLLITDAGGKIVKTPRYTADQNCQVRKANVTLDTYGGGTADISTDYCYEFFDGMRGLLYADQETRKKYITNNVDIPGFSLVNFSVRQPDPDKPVMNETLSIKLSKYTTIMSDRMLLPVNLMNRVERLPSNVADRKMDIEIKRDKKLIDEITYKIPSGYAVTALPQPIEIKSQFGHYKAEVIQNGNEIIYKREISYNKGIYPVGDYQQLLDFYKSISAADNAKLALKKQM
jgi:hypothetical protein